MILFVFLTYLDYYNLDVHHVKYFQYRTCKSTVDAVEDVDSNDIDSIEIDFFKYFCSGFLHKKKRNKQLKISIIYNKYYIYVQTK